MSNVVGVVMTCVGILALAWALSGSPRLAVGVAGGLLATGSALLLIDLDVDDERADK